MDPYNTRNHTLEVSARTLRGRHSRGLRSRNSDSPDEVSVFVCTTTPTTLQLRCTLEVSALTLGQSRRGMWLQTPNH